jgi:hypothetical protein
VFLFNFSPVSSLAWCKSIIQTTLLVPRKMREYDVLTLRWSWCSYLFRHGINLPAFCAVFPFFLGILPGFARFCPPPPPHSSGPATAGPLFLLNCQVMDHEIPFFSATKPRRIAIRIQSIIPPSGHADILPAVEVHTRCAGDRMTCRPIQNRT